MAPFRMIGPKLELLRKADVARVREHNNPLVPRDGNAVHAGVGELAWFQGLIYKHLNSLTFETY